MTAPDWAVRAVRVVLVAVFCAMAASACASSPPENTANACAIFAEKRGWWGGARAAERRWDVEPSLILAIIEQESSFDRDARPERGRFLFVFPGRRPSSAFGFAQATDPTWERYKEATGRRFAARDSFDDAADFIGWYANESRRISGIALDDARNQYLAYHEGQGGFNRRSYRSKGWLLDIAEGVARQERTYARQLQSCERRLNRRFIIF